MEEEPRINLTLDGEHFEATRENASLFTFIGELAVYDHVFLQRSGDDEHMTGTYLFGSLIGDSYATIAAFMLEKGFPCHINLLGVAECDREAFERNVELQASDVENGVPEDWT